MPDVLDDPQSATEGKMSTGTTSVVTERSEASEPQHGVRLELVFDADDSIKVSDFLGNIETINEILNGVRLLVEGGRFQSIDSRQLNHIVATHYGSPWSVAIDLYNLAAPHAASIVLGLQGLVAGTTAALLQIEKLRGKKQDRLSSDRRN